jgi:general secretion pathway protein N
MRRTLGQWSTLVLGGVCGLLALLATLQSLGVGSGYNLLDEEQVALDEDLTRPMQQIEFSLPAFAQYIEIGQRPLFTNDRKPRPIDASAATAVATDAPPAVPLNATLLGVLIDPEHQVAILRDNTSSAVIRVRQGMPLPGDLSGWTLQELAPRRAIFDGGVQQGTAELKLDMSKTPAGPPVPPPGMAPPPNPQAAAAPGGQPEGQPGAPAPPLPVDEAARQAEVQRIIEQRRAQMRAEAEKMNQQQGKQ